MNFGSHIQSTAEGLSGKVKQTPSDIWGRSVLGRRIQYEALLKQVHVHVFEERQRRSGDMDTTAVITC